MLTRRPSSKETTTLCWEMPDDAWAHWTQGRGEKSVSVRDVILEGIDQIRKSPEAVKNIRKRCEGVSREDQGKHEEVVQSLKHKIKIQLPSGDWAAACQRVGPIDEGGEGDNPVRPGQLLAALIFESKSWKQDGEADAELNAGWNENSLASSTSTTAGLSLGRQETIIAWIVIAAAVVAATAAVASAIAAWCNP